MSSMILASPHHRPVSVIGAGGHAKVVVSTLHAAGYPVAGIYDDDPGKRGSTILGVPIKGSVLELPRAGEVPAVIAVGSNAAREALMERLADREWISVVHPRACVHPTVQLGPGSVVFAGAVIQPDSVIGAHVIVNTGATVDHDCQLGDFVHLAPGVHLAGDVRVGRGAFLGTGSAVVPGRLIGDWATIGAGAVVVRDIRERTTAVGVPARPLRKT